MKRAILFILIGAAIGGGGVWIANRGHAKPDATEKPAEKPAEEEEPKTTVTRDEAGHAIIHIGDETQGNMGLLVAHPVAAHRAPEVKAYGRVLDPAPLAEMLRELGKAQLTYDSVHQELERMKVLKKDNNASERAFEIAETAYRQNFADVFAVWFKIKNTYGERMAEFTGEIVVPPGTERKPNPVLDALAGARGVFLVRLDLPVPEALNSAPAGARIVGLGEGALPVQAEFFGDVPAVDPQTQARGYLFLVSTNRPNLTPGMAVMAFIQTAEQMQSGVIVPREAVVRTEGAGWVYVQNAGGEAYTRTQIPLDHPAESGWFISQGMTTNGYVVVTGAQQLLSEELKGQGGGKNEQRAEDSGQTFQPLPV